MNDFEFHEKYDLMKLDIPPEFVVIDNLWFDVEPDYETIHCFNDSMMLEIQSIDERYSIDLTYYPVTCTAEGRYHVAFWNYTPADSSMASSSCLIGGGAFNDRNSAAKAIEKFMQTISQHDEYVQE